MDCNNTVDDSVDEESDTNTNTAVSVYTDHPKLVKDQKYVITTGVKSTEFPKRQNCWYHKHLPKVWVGSIVGKRQHSQHGQVLSGVIRRIMQDPLHLEKFCYYIK
jgi:hypothetical protein